MEQELLQIIGVFTAGVVVGVIIMLLLNKLRGGSLGAADIKHEYEQYQSEVERHFEETSKKFQDMTAQYQDIYKHLSVGATSLCRPDSVAAALADQRSPIDTPAKLEEAASDDAQAEPPADNVAENQEPSAEPAEQSASQANSKVNSAVNKAE